MKYTNITRGALALALGVMTSATFAANLYEEGFESTAYTNNHPIVLEAKWAGGPDDLSKVVPSNYTFTAASTPLSGDHTKVLQLNTEGGTLTNELTSVASFETNNVYVDAMVQFVPSEDLPDLGGDADVKVAVYSYISTKMVGESEVTSTNLAVYHAFVNPAKLLKLTNTVTELAIDADAWYRLTIRLGNRNVMPIAQGFEVYLNGIPVTNDIAFAAADFASVHYGNDTPGNGTWFLSAGIHGTTKDSIAALQFKGTGYIDDLVVAKDAPSYPYAPPTTFEVTQTVGENGYGSDETSPIAVNVGSTTSLTYTASEFYRIATLTTNAVPITLEDQKSYTVTAGDAMAIKVTFARPEAYSAGNVSWFAANNWTEADVANKNPSLSYDQLYMLNVAATNAAAGGTITIEAIEVAGTDVKVTVLIDRTMSINANLGTGVELTLSGADDLTGTFADLGTVTIGADLEDSQDDIRKEITFTAAGSKKFYKAVIKTAH